MTIKTLTAQCHCGHFALSLTLPSTDFPLNSSFCNCTSCRYSTGQLAASFAVIPTPKNELNLNISRLSRYDSSKHRSRYFCPNCGANVLDLADDGRWRFCTGVTDETAGLLDRNVIFVGDTKDGGIAVWLKHLKPMFVAGPGTGAEEVDLAALTRPSYPSLPEDARLQCKCHCGGVSFQILPPKEGQGFTAGIDTCTSCRLTTGFELCTWTSVPLDNVQMADGKPLDLSAGTLKYHNSSKGVYRYFCRTCGATVFCAKDDQSWIDIAAGLLRAEEGARAERWLDWREIGYPDEATDQELIGKLKEEFEDWGGERVKLEIKRIAEEKKRMRGQ